MTVTKKLVDILPISTSGQQAASVVPGPGLTRKGFSLSVFSLAYRGVAAMGHAANATNGKEQSHAERKPHQKTMEVAHAPEKYGVPSVYQAPR